MARAVTASINTRLKELESRRSGDFAAKDGEKLGVGPSTYAVLRKREPVQETRPPDRSCP
jgi:hypothetical protein